MAGQREVFFVDAAHFVWTAFLGYLWFWSRLFVLAPSGRKRFNVLGAIHARTHQLITVTNTTYINADSICELLSKVSKIGFQMPITLVLDSASPTKRLCLTAFPTPHDRLLRDGYGLRRPSRPRSLVQRQPGRFTAFADDSTDGRDALPSASGRRSRATLRRTARPSSFWGA